MGTNFKTLKKLIDLYNRVWKNYLGYNTGCKVLFTPKPYLLL